MLNLLTIIIQSQKLSEIKGKYLFRPIDNQHESDPSFCPPKNKKIYVLHRETGAPRKDTCNNTVTSAYTVDIG